MADLHGRVRDDISLMDGMALSETLTRDFAMAIIEANKMPGKSKIVIGTGTNLAKASTLATILTGLYSSGMEPDDPSIKELGGMIGLGLQRSVRAPQGLGAGFGGVPASVLSQMVRVELSKLGAKK